MNITEMKTLAEILAYRDRKIADLQIRQKADRRQLLKAAKEKKSLHSTLDSGGISCEIVCDNGSIAHINWPAPTLKSSISTIAVKNQIRAICGEKCRFMFKTTTALVPSVVSSDFGWRAYIRSSLGARLGNKLIKLCESTSSPRVSYETKPESETR